MERENHYRESHLEIPEKTLYTSPGVKITPSKVYLPGGDAIQVKDIAHVKFTDEAAPVPFRHVLLTGLLAAIALIIRRSPRVEIPLLIAMVALVAYQIYMRIPIYVLRLRTGDKDDPLREVLRTHRLGKAHRVFNTLVEAMEPTNQGNYILVVKASNGPHHDEITRLPPPR